MIDSDNSAMKSEHGDTLKENRFDSPVFYYKVKFSQYINFVLCKRFLIRLAKMAYFWLKGSKFKR